jgi:rhodanese-related sulfurtransferase
MHIFSGVLKIFLKIHLPGFSYKRIIWILLVSCALGLIFNWINRKGISLIAHERTLNWGTAPLSVPLDMNEPYSVNLQQAKELYEENDLFIDAREKEEFESGHIKGAINIPFENMDDYIRKLKNIPKDKRIVTYCSGTDCDLSILLGNRLSEMGYKNVFIFFGGWTKWLNAGYPAEGNLKK